MPTPSLHVALALYAVDTAIIDTTRKPTLLVSYLASYINDLRRWLSEWRNTITVSKSASITFAPSSPDRKNVSGSKSNGSKHVIWE